MSWVGQAKVAAIGVKISRGIAHHGFAINVNPDLTKFAQIVPCGITDRPVTSMAHLLGANCKGEVPDMATVQQSAARRFGEAMGYGMGSLVSHNIDGVDSHD